MRHVGRRDELTGLFITEMTRDECFDLPATPPGVHPKPGDMWVGDEKFIRLGSPVWAPVLSHCYDSMRSPERRAVVFVDILGRRLNRWQSRHSDSVSI